LNRVPTPFPTPPPPRTSLSATGLATVRLSVFFVELQAETDLLRLPVPFLLADDNDQTCGGQSTQDVYVATSYTKVRFLFLPHLPPSLSSLTLLFLNPVVGHRRPQLGLPRLLPRQHQQQAFHREPRLRPEVERQVLPCRCQVRSLLCRRSRVRRRVLGS
jgi:hypothetical protein